MEQNTPAWHIGRAALALLAVGSIRSAREQAGGSLHFQLGIPTPEHANPTLRAPKKSPVPPYSEDTTFIEEESTHLHLAPVFLRHFAKILLEGIHASLPLHPHRTALLLLLLDDFQFNWRSLARRRHWSVCWHSLTLTWWHLPLTNWKKITIIMMMIIIIIIMMRTS